MRKPYISHTTKSSVYLDFLLGAKIWVVRGCKELMKLPDKIGGGEKCGSLDEGFYKVEFDVLLVLDLLLLS